MSWFNDYEDFIRAVYSLEYSDFSRLSDVNNAEPFEKLKHWLYCSIRNESCDFDLSFIPNKKLADKFVALKQKEGCKEKGYLSILGSSMTEFEDCFDNKPVRNIRWDVSLVNTGSEEVKALKSENEALKSEIESLKAELAKKKEKGLDWMEICDAILREDI